MAAIITEQFRRQSRALLLNDISTNNYYIGIGKQDDWSEDLSGVQTSPFPLGTLADQARVRDNLSGLFRISTNRISTVLPKNTVDSARAYKVYNPYDPTCFYANDNTGEFPCFVVSNLASGGNGSHVFLCLQKTQSATVASVSANELGGLGKSVPGIYSFNDGYTWAYIGIYNTTDPINSNAFVGFNFSQQLPEETPSNTLGLIYGFHILNGGSLPVQTNATTVSLSIKIAGYKLNNSQSEYSEITVSATGIIEAGQSKLSKIIGPDLTQTNLKNWIRAKATILTAGYESVKIEPMIAPIVGFENSLEQCLPSWYVAFYADTFDSAYVPSGTSYRQISLIRNPKNAQGSSTLTASYVQPLKYFTRSAPLQQTIPSSASAVLDAGWKIIQNNREVGTIAYVQTHQSNDELAEYRYYYYNSSNGGFALLDDSSDLTFVPPADVSSDNIVISAPETFNQSDSTGYSTNSGDILFIDNRGAVLREEGQNEELKIIIQL